MRHHIGLGGIVIMLALVACGGGSEGDDAPPCGNLVIDPGEVCDDGNATGGDGCSAACDSDETCGNLVHDVAIGEACDDGNQVAGDGCSADCRSDESCGNGVVDIINGETCDDANSTPNDGCSANCQSNETCGNGYADVGEYCDTGGATATCDADCTMVQCGDMVRNAAAGEACDAGGVATATCDPNCTTVVCHDGYRNIPAGEQCDDGNTSNTDACVGNCVNATCGDGYVWNGMEECDGGANCVNCQLAEPVTYTIGLANLVNQPTDCGTPAPQTNVYDTCLAEPIGFAWQDVGGFAPSSIRIEFNSGVFCGVAVNATTLLNGVAAGTFAYNNLNACVCPPPLGLNVWTISGAGYAVNGSNTFLINGNTSCDGFTTPGSLGGFARVTVFP